MHHLQRAADDAAAAAGLITRCIECGNFRAQRFIWTAMRRHMESDLG